MSRLLVAALLLTIGCGDEGGSNALYVPFPAAGALSCGAGVPASTTVSVALWIKGGFELCEGLSVDHDTLAVSGRCSQPIPTGTTRPVALAYFATDPQGTTEALAYFVSYVNLCAVEQRELSLAFVDDDVSGSFIFQPMELDAIAPASAAPSCELSLGEAKALFMEDLPTWPEPKSLDTDGDCAALGPGCSNLEELCGSQG